MNEPNPPQPFTDDADYLDLAFAHLVAEARRIGAERRLVEDVHSLPLWHHDRTLGRQGTVGEEETRRQADALVAEEHRLRKQLDARLTAHRADKARPTLGIDVVTEEAGLSEQERMVLLVCSALAISPDIGKAITEGLGTGAFSRFGVEGAMTLMEPQGVAGWLGFRRLFLRTAPLVRHDLIAIEFPSVTFGPTDVLAATVEVTHKGLALVTGDPTLANENPANKDG